MAFGQVAGAELQVLEQLFAGWEETLIWSCLQGCMGSAWAERTLRPDCARLEIGDFCFFGGKAEEALVRFSPPTRKGNFVIMVPQSTEWGRQIEAVYGNNAKACTRYAIKKEADVFELPKLEALASQLPPGYELRQIDAELYQRALENAWSRDWCAQFTDCADYMARGLGFVALCQGELAAGASSYTVYRSGIEVEVDTHLEHRRCGLATACAARLILECLRRGLYPSWDAQNLWSVALSEKLGYHFDKAYAAYEVNLP